MECFSTIAASYKIGWRLKKKNLKHCYLKKLWVQLGGPVLLQAFIMKFVFILYSFKNNLIAICF